MWFTRINFCFFRHISGEQNTGSELELAPIWDVVSQDTALMAAPQPQCQLSHSSSKDNLDQDQAALTLSSVTPKKGRASIGVG